MDPLRLGQTAKMIQIKKEIKLIVRKLKINAISSVIGRY